MPIRPELEALPARMADLPLDDRGYPVPWFVAWENGKPEFRAADTTKRSRAIRERRCWVCGGPLGRYLAFVIGPMCGINRTTGEPACHLECAEWSARNCPFLTRPQMVRREDDTMNAAALAAQSSGNAIPRNPGVTLIWITRSFDVFPVPGAQWLIRVGNPERLIWYARGRKATRDEVTAAVDSGIPILLDVAKQQDAEEPTAGAVAMLLKMAREFEREYPPA